MFLSDRTYVSRARGIGLYILWSFWHHDSNVAVYVQVRVTGLRLVYAIVRLSSGETMISFRSSMWISSGASVSKILRTSEVASATHTSVRMQGILRLGTKFSLMYPTSQPYARRWDIFIEASGTFHQRSNEQAEMVLFAGHMYTHSKRIKQAHVQETEREAPAVPASGECLVDRFNIPQPNP